MSAVLRRIFSEYRKWRKNWDDLCRRCGKCCYQRSLSKNGEVIIDYSAPCEYYSKETKHCAVFDKRFLICGHCGSVNFFCALFNRLLPPDCAYAETFRVWKKPDNADA